MMYSEHHNPLSWGLVRQPYHSAFVYRSITNTGGIDLMLDNQLLPMLCLNTASAWICCSEWPSIHSDGNLTQQPIETEHL